MTTSLKQLPGTIPALLASRATATPDKPFIVDGVVTLTYKQTQEQAHALAAWLISEGCTQGDRVAIWAPNCQQWIVAALGAQAIGATVVTLNTRYKGAEAADVLRRSGARFLFSVKQFLDVDYPALLQPFDLPDLIATVTLMVHSQSDDFASVLEKGRELLATEDGEKSFTAASTTVTADTVSDILFTSGTTGQAKGVVTDHGQNLEAFSAFVEILGLDASDHYLIINPFFHSFGYKAGWLATMIAGATAFPLAVFDVPTVIAQVQKHRINVMPGPPTLFQSLLSHKDFDRAKLQTLNKATTGAAVIPTQLIKDMWEKLGLETVITAYGLSETCGLVTMCRRGDDAQTIASTSGRSIPNIEVAIFDSDGNRLPAMEPGEIVVRGYNVMRSYFENPIATAETIDSEGWLHTGDIGFLDTNDNLHITDRLKDMYISGGFNCYPAEIEQQLCQHPAIAQAAVIGTPDSRLGEVGAAFVIPNNSSPPADQEIISWCREVMANYKVPKQLFWVDTLPLNATGKILKTELRNQLNLDKA
jgi:acyl-CoA synthetase (AMP-forming)/AMP-acid ligase II